MGSSRREAASTTIQLTTEHEHDFWARVDRSEEGGCWLWTGFRDKKGYPWLKIDNKLNGAQRIAWVLHHRQALPSYQQIRRRCKNTSCVRPTHLKRINRSFADYAKRATKLDYIILKPIVGGKSDAPNRETIEALSGSFKELQQLKHVLHTLTAALPENTRNLQKSLTKLQSSGEEYKVSIEELKDEILAWKVKVEKRFDRIESTLDEILELKELKIEELKKSSKPKPRSSVPIVMLAPDPEPEKELKPVNGKMTKLLMSAFQAALGGPENPDSSDYESLDMVFDIALGESSGSTEAVERFGAWLTSFRELTTAHPSLEKSPQGFARQVAARRL